MLNSIEQHPKSSAVIGLLSLVALSSIITAVVNYAKPECTKSLVNLFGGEKSFALAATLIASTFLAIAAAGIACIAVSHSKEKEIKNLKNNPINRTIIEIMCMERIGLTLNKEGLSVTNNLGELTFDENGKSKVITKNGEVLTLIKEKKNNEVSYKVTGYKEKYDDKNSIEDVETIKGKLFNKNSRKSKNITVFDSDKVSKLHNAVIKAAFSRVI